MRVIVTHEQPDFDAVAAAALAARLHPGARIAFADGLPAEVRGVVRLYRDRLEPLSAEEVLAGPVHELIVVDTADASRLGPFAELARRAPVTVYDHHPPPPEADALPPGRGLIRPVGATVTLLALELERRGADLPADLASLALLGLHQDTGGFAHAGTCEEDHRAAAWLHARGATLAVARRFARSATDEEHRSFRTRMFEHAHHVTVRGRAVAVAAFPWPSWLSDIAGFANELMDAHAADAALLAVRMEDRTLVIARSDGRSVNVGAALRDAVGGGGHAGAAFGRSTEPLDEVLTRTLAAFERHALPPRTARDVMSRPVRTVAADATVHDAAALLLRHGHNGLPATEADGTVAGVISRRDLNRALRMGLGRSKVRGFMGAPPVTAGEDATLDELEALVARRAVGRLPILSGDGSLVGIVTRSDLLAARHAAAGEGTSPAERIAARLRDQAGSVLREVVRALPPGGRVWAVGGTVRDALAGGPLADLDLTLEEASVHQVAAALASATGGRTATHEAFDTASVALPGGLVVDLAAAREERYAQPGALPEVEPSDLRRDLRRRDFTVNAMALRWWPQPLEWSDPYGGREDLAAGLLRVLHPLSFVEDPTRIVRGVRLAARLGLRFEPETERLARTAVREGRVAGASAERLRAELDLLLREPRPGNALKIAESLDLISGAYGLGCDPALLTALDAAAQQGREVPPDAYRIALLLGAGPEQRQRARERFHFPARLAAAAERIAAWRDGTEVPSEAQLEAIGTAGRAVAAASGGATRAATLQAESLAGRRRLRGRDLLELGLAPGPQVGRILAQVARARRERRVRDFDEELALARSLLPAASEATAERNDDPT